MAKHIILGATGHVGSAAAHTLLDRGEAVVAVTHDAAKADDLKQRGAEIAVVDIHDSDALRDLFKTGERAFLLNPPAAPSTDTDAEEERTAAAIVAALDGSGLEKVVAASTAGARPGEEIGDSSVLYHFEQALAAQPIPAAINRAAYYFSNWDAFLGSARDDGVIRSPFPADFVLPMVAPADVGRAAARRMLTGPDDAGVRFVEGLARVPIADVVGLFSELVDRPVRLETVPRDQIDAMFRSQGFSPAGARAYARMTIDALEDPRLPDDFERGAISLRAYLTELVKRAD